ncbi:MAG: proline dehydrogenase [Acidobacteria bacterium]|nr:MAG: proline dehydrogenase [Acidobacteriota bacterium]
MSIFDSLVIHGLPLVPKFIVGRFAKPYVAGSTIDAAVKSIRSIMDEGAMATVDILGEEVSDRSLATSYTNEYLEIFDVIASERLDANVSIKPTMLGMKIDEAFCADNIEAIAAKAQATDNFLRIDMEDHTTTDPTLRIYRTMVERHGHHVGVVLQSYMRRTADDINDLRDLKPNIRMCKGIYREPRTVAWGAFETVRENFTYTIEKLFRAGSYVGIATHDSHLVWAAMSLIDRLGLNREQYEFQMLYGVDPELRRIILDGGHRLRVYVPFGKDWYPYSMRRLRENPTIAKNVLLAMMGKKTL